MISQAQIEYMLNLMYSEASLRDQIEIKKYQFLILEVEGKPSGFAAYSKKSEQEPGVFRLHKLYLLPTLHGRNLGKKLLVEVERRTKTEAGLMLELNVNRKNPAFHFYIKNNFKILREEDIDIGEGYYMNDYVMIKDLYQTS